MVLGDGTERPQDVVGCGAVLQNELGGRAGCLFSGFRVRNWGHGFRVSVFGFKV